MFDSDSFVGGRQLWHYGPAEIEDIQGTHVAAGDLSRHVLVVQITARCGCTRMTNPETLAGSLVSGGTDLTLACMTHMEVLAVVLRLCDLECLNNLIVYLNSLGQGRQANERSRGGVHVMRSACGVGM